MNACRIARHALIASVLAFGAAGAATNPIDEVASADGLQKVKAKNVDLAYVRPGATLAGYSKVMLEPVDVAFRKDWNPERPGSRLKVSQADRENIRTGVGKIVYDEFAKTLTSKGPYQMASAAGPDVLRVKAKILNLYVNAPDTKTAGAYALTLSAGEMTLLLELFDSETGEILARVVDRREGRNTGQMQLTSSVVNRAEAADIAATWARLLRKALDNAHGLGKK
jgi:hypothetical protein